MLRGRKGKDTKADAIYGWGLTQQYYMLALVTAGFVVGIDFCRILVLIHLYKFSIKTGSQAKNFAIAIFLPMSTEFMEEMTLNLEIKGEENETVGAAVSLKSIGGELSQGGSS